MSDIVERLNAIWANDDHDRGCQGREYSCSCGYDNRTAKTAEDAATEISRLRQLLSEAETREREARVKALNHAAVVAYATCAETRHVTLGDKVAAAIRALQSEER
ncbi:hypothetical protein O9X80_07955 [Agrobacterium salinitolerans]|uniref:hypothetical protein n=1 Tax=Agrobacterium salinitolerans TaxID=1183413 RepID=UPI0022B84712|nr:hypothetical protein [Agrobacterium salinitolerans]MCZ7974422.1 hypothetical protein [Agrobacterium salinitolerans]